MESNCSCILGELFTKEPLFRGSGEMAQLDAISRLCGTPTPDVWPDVIQLPLYSSFRPRKFHRRVIKEQFAQ